MPFYEVHFSPEKSQLKIITVSETPITSEGGNMVIESDDNPEEFAAKLESTSNCHSPSS